MQALGPDLNPSNRDRIEAQAAHLLARLNNGPSPADKTEIFAWIDADPRHAVAFARAEMGWDAAGQLKSSDVNIILPLAEVIISENGSPRVSRKVIIAAIIAIVLLIIAAIVMIRTFDGIRPL